MTAPIETPPAGQPEVAGESDFSVAAEQARAIAAQLGLMWQFPNYVRRSFEDGAAEYVHKLIAAKVVETGACTNCEATTFVCSACGARLGEN